MKKRNISIMLLTLVVVMAVIVSSAFAAATTKTLSTVFAVQNLSSTTTANVVVDYRFAKNDGGGPWTNVSAASSTFTVTAGSAVNIAQYFDPTMTNGRGSATISADQPIAAIVNQLARNQVATSGSYSGFDSGAGSVYAPLVFKNLSTSVGTINSTLTIMNTGSAATDFNIVYISAVTFQPVFTATVSNLAVGESYYADQSLEAGLPNGYYGSAVVNATTGGGTLAVVGNQFTGSDGLLTYNGFKSTEGFTSWAVPLYLCRLANGFSSPITVQNVSGSQLDIGAISIAFSPSAGSPFTVTNPSAIPPNASYVFNPRVDLTCPTGSQGSAIVTASGNVVVLVNELQAGSAAAMSYNGVRTDSTNKTALSPVTFSRLANGYSTVMTVQNLNLSASGTVTFTYTPNTLCGGCLSYTAVMTTTAGGNAIQNHRLSAGQPLPAGWYGSTKITSDQPIAAVVNQLDLSHPGDGSLSFNAISQP